MDKVVDRADEGIIRCICGLIEDDGFTIQCERCYVWQHASINADGVPDIYYCEKCEPRILDPEKALQLQTKRLKDERKLKRLEKQSPRKRKESQDLMLKKRAKDSGPLSPRKRFKELNDSIGDISMRMKKPDEEVEERKRGRPRLISVTADQTPYAKLPIVNPKIVKKDHKEEVAHYNSRYEEEYVHFANKFAFIDQNRFTTQSVKAVAELVLTNRPAVCIKDPFTEAESDVVLTRRDYTVEDQLYPYPTRAQYGSIEGSQFGLFSTQVLKLGSYITEIKGTISTQQDLDLRRGFCISYPLSSHIESFVYPSYVFRLPCSPLFVDSRDCGNFDGRFVRSACSNSRSLANAELKVLYRPKEVTDRIIVALFTSRQLGVGEEIIVASEEGFGLFRCVCDDVEKCSAHQTIQKVEEYHRFECGGKDPDVRNDESYFGLLRKRELDRRALITANDKSQPSTWVYQEPTPVEEEEEEVEEEEEEEEKEVEVEEKQVVSSPKVVEESVERNLQLKIEIVEDEPMDEVIVVEPRRVSLKDFMKQLSTPALDVPPLIPELSIQIPDSNFKSQPSTAPVTLTKSPPSSIDPRTLEKIVRRVAPPHSSPIPYNNFVYTPLVREIPPRKVEYGRERRESEPVYPLYARDARHQSPPPRSYSNSYRDSFPPVRNDNRPPIDSRDIRSIDSRDIRPIDGRDIRSIDSRDTRPIDGRDIRTMDNRDLRNPIDGREMSRSLSERERGFNGRRDFYPVQGPIVGPNFTPNRGRGRYVTREDRGFDRWNRGSRGRGY